VNAHVPGAATEILPADDGCLPADEIVRSVRCEKRAVCVWVCVCVKVSIRECVPYRN
jgi:hypothetical protein